MTSTDTSTSRHKIRRWVLWLGMFGIALAAVGNALSAQLAWIKFFDNLHWTSATLAAAILAELGRRDATPEQRRTQTCFALGFAGYALGQLTWDLQSWLDYHEFPSPSDCFYLWLGPCLSFGLVNEIRRHCQKSTCKIIFLDTLSLSTAALTLVLALYLPHRGDMALLALSVLIAYPVSLLIVVAIVLMMIPNLRIRPTLPLTAFLMSTLITALSWMRWNLLAFGNATIDGDPLNLSFSVAVLLAGLVCSQWHLEQSKQPLWIKLCEGFLRFLPLINVLLASAAVVAVTANNSELVLQQKLTIGGALLVILLAMIRQGALLKDREQLLLTQALLRTVIDTAPLRIFWKNTQCRYLGCNQAFARDAGFREPNELLGKDDQQLAWRSQALLYQEDDRSVMNSRQAKLNYEEPQIGPDGRQIWLRTSKVPLLDAEGQVIGVLGVYDEISHIKDYQDNLKLTARVFENTQEMLMVTGADRKILNVNDAFCKITGYSREEVLGKTPGFLRSGMQNKSFYQTMWQAIRNTGHWNGEIWNRKKDGSIYPELLTISTISDEQGRISHYVGIASDISHIKQHEKQLEHIAHYDALTGVPNRVLLVDRMKQAIAQTRREHKLLAICYLDLDGFKPINDHYGHHIGDRVLIELTERMTHIMRESDTLARLGGDEFVVLLQGLEQIDECWHSMDRLLRCIAEPIHIEQMTATVTASIGLTIYPLDDQDPDTLLRHADHAMYQAKQLGKNRHFLYDASEDQHARDQQAFFKEIADGLQQHEFELFYQPKVKMATRQVVGVEALIRWRHPQRGLLTPNRFLPEIENTPMEIAVGDWVIDCALAQAGQWLRAGHSIPISVNVAGPQLLEADFLAKLASALARHPEVPPELLELEILETAALEIARSSSLIDSVRSQLGVAFALDDFGTGYSTLTYLKQLPVSTLKIDQSFVRDMLEDQGDRAIVEGVIALAKVFGRKTVAEGVETDKHFQMLQTLGCQIAQGYYIAKPMPAAELMSWYQTYCRDR